MKHIFQISDERLYSFAFMPIDSKMYILLHEDQAIVIDPCISEEAKQLLISNNVSKVIIILTHEHYDHISGVNYFKKNFDCAVYCNNYCAKAIGLPRKNLSQYFPILFCMKDDYVQEQVSKMEVQPYSCNADKTFSDALAFDWNGHSISMIETPGHTQGSICICIDNAAVFTGDSLVNGNRVVTRLPSGSREKYADVTWPYLNSLNGEMMAFPGHGEPMELRLLLGREKEYAS